MSSSLIQLLVLAGIALFLILRLRSVLGTRDGFEKPPVTGASQSRLSKRPEFDVIDRYTGQVRKFLNFCSYNYLGYSFHPEVKQAVQGAVEKYGTGAVSAPLLSGYYDLTYQLEQTIAQFKGQESAIVFPTGYSANLGTLSGLLRP